MKILDLHLDEVKENATDVLVRIASFIGEDDLQPEQLASMVAFQQSFGYNAHKKHTPNPRVFGFDEKGNAPFFDASSSTILKYYKLYAPTKDKRQAAAANAERAGTRKATADPPRARGNPETRSGRHLPSEAKAKSSQQPRREAAREADASRRQQAEKTKKSRAQRQHKS